MFDHVTLRVADRQTSERFYETVLRTATTARPAHGAAPARPSPWTPTATPSKW